MIPAIALLAHLLIGTPPDQPAPALRIVVIEGEDAINVIQQKSAVAPVVEVRDRNNLPVAGATVTFTIGGNTASFAGGVQTFSIVTNAAGQAAAATVSPVASGAVQINVAAAFQGQGCTRVETWSGQLIIVMARTEPLEQSNTFPPGPNEVGGINRQFFKFTGALNGAEITGTLMHARRVEPTGGGVTGTGTATVSVTLR